jgi:hypothetical protein
MENIYSGIFNLKNMIYRYCKCSGRERKNMMESKIEIFNKKLTFLRRKNNIFILWYANRGLKWFNNKK